ncbi:MAG TPA: flagellar motor protein MotB [Terriglobales bacterium]|nr:flagellar motor protein MotB [Terriglobales bacterium]
MDGSRPIIIIKKKAGHGGHHGGAWKVAYADFVTAMMALFIVLWLLNTSKPVREAVAGYFKDPAGTANKIGSSKAGVAEALAITKDDMPKLKEELEKAISKVPNFEKIKDQIEMTITPEGLRIELLETATGTFFELGSPEPNGNGKELLSLLAQELGKLPNHLSIEGHTDSKPYAGRREYGNWELSTDRANAARRLMQHDGLRGDQVSQVRGYADQMLRKKDEPLDASNRRISVIVQNLEQKPEEPQKTDGKPETSTPPQSPPKKD